jgi:hypothetical protein
MSLTFTRVSIYNAVKKDKCGKDKLRVNEYKLNVRLWKWKRKGLGLEFRT